MKNRAKMAMLKGLDQLSDEDAKALARCLKTLLSMHKQSGLASNATIGDLLRYERSKTRSRQRVLN